MAGGMFNIDLLGDKELAKQFREMPEKIQASLLRGSLRDAFKPVLTVARALARKKSGSMARTLKLRAMKRKKGRIGVYIRTGTRAELNIAMTKRGAQLAGRILGGGRYTRAQRQALQSIGRTQRTQARRIAAGKDPGYYPAHIELGTKHNPAYPYLRAAFDQAREATFARVAESMNRALDEAG